MRDAGVWSGVRWLAAWLADHEIWWLVPTVPLLIFPGRWNVVGLALLPVPWLCRWIGQGRLTVRTPVDWAIVLLLLMIPVTLWATALPEVTRPAVWKLLAGVGVFYSIVNWASSERRIWWASLGLIALGLGLAVIAPVSVRWESGSRLFTLPQIYGRSSLLLEDSINVNIMAGVLALIMPMALALLGWDRGRGGADGARRYVLVVGVGLSLVFMGLVSVLTKSRGAYIAIAAALLVVAVLRSRWFLAGLPLGLAGLGVAWWRLGGQPLADLLTTTQVIGGWEGRQEVWSRAIYMMQDFPFTGVGMGTFNQVANVMYPFFLHGPDAEIGHAHNLVLQVGVDLGYPGLIAYLALLLLCFWTAWQTYRRGSQGKGVTRREEDTDRRRGGVAQRDLTANSLLPSAFQAPLSVGLLGSLTALVVHGLTDAVMWGTKPAIVAWAVLGLTVALHDTTSTSREGQAS